MGHAVNAEEEWGSAGKARIEAYWDWDKEAKRSSREYVTFNYDMPPGAPSRRYAYLNLYFNLYFRELIGKPGVSLRLKTSSRTRSSKPAFRFLSPEAILFIFFYAPLVASEEETGVVRSFCGAVTLPVEVDLANPSELSELPPFSGISL